MTTDDIILSQIEDKYSLCSEWVGYKGDKYVTKMPSASVTFDDIRWMISRIKELEIKNKDLLEQLNVTIYL